MKHMNDTELEAVSGGAGERPEMCNPKCALCGKDAVYATFEIQDRYGVFSEKKETLCYDCLVVRTEQIEKDGSKVVGVHAVL